MSEDGKNGQASDADDAIREALESVERLERERGSDSDDLDPDAIEVLAPGSGPPSGDPSGEGTPPDAALEREFKNLPSEDDGDALADDAYEGEESEGFEEEILVEDEAPKKKGKDPKDAMLEAMIAAKNEAVAALAQTQVEAKSFQERYVRSRADFENYKKRQERERDEAVKFANERLLKELMPVIDNMERAMDAARKTAAETEADSVKNVIDGIEMVYRQFMDTFSKFGVEAFSAAGQPFDPARHEAVAQREDTSVPSGTVIEEYQRGFLLSGRLVRPSMVVVSTGGPAPGQKATKASSDDADEPADGGASTDDANEGEDA